MSLQRISDFAENQEEKALFLRDSEQGLGGLTFGSFPLDRLCEQHRFE